jgi:hypothetical protein
MRYTAAHARAKLKGHHILFVGDSVTRYQYLHFVTFIHTGKWPTRETIFDNKRYGPNIVRERDFQDPAVSSKLTELACPNGRNISDCRKDTWRAFYVLGSATFDGYEVCDCHRYYKNGRTDARGTHENRFCHNSNLGMEVSYLMQYGLSNPMYGYYPRNISTNGSAMPRTAHEPSLSDRFEQYMERGDHAKYPLDYAVDVNATHKPSSSLTEVFKLLRKKWRNDVDVVLWNVGVWDAGIDGKQTEARAVMKAVNSFLQQNGRNGVAFWKGSTAYHVDHWDKMRDQFAAKKDAEAHLAARHEQWGVIDYVEAMQQIQAETVWPAEASWYNDFLWDSCHLQPCMCTLVCYTLTLQYNMLPFTNCQCVACHSYALQGYTRSSIRS